MTHRQTDTRTQPFIVKDTDMITVIVIILAEKKLEIMRNIATHMSTTGRENPDFISHIYCGMIFEFIPPFRNL